MAQILNFPRVVASPVDVHRALLTAELPRARRRGEAGGFRPLHVLSAWLERARTRRELRRLDDTLLRDAGLDPAMVRAEVRRPFFLPIHLDRSMR
jgi:uncharacterized protein YjiS (DUF1127 family)